MAVETEADRLAFLDAADFGVAVTIGEETVSGMLVEPFAETLDVEGSAPRLVCRTSDVTDVAAVAHGTAITIGDDSYTVRGVQPDGEGMTVLTLEAAS